MWQQYVLMGAITAIQIIRMDAKLSAKLRPYVIQVRDLCLMIVPLDEHAFSKRAALKKVK